MNTTAPTDGHTPDGSNAGARWRIRCSLGAGTGGAGRQAEGDGPVIR